MSLEPDAECSLAKEEQSDPFFLYSNTSSAVGTIMYVRSKSGTTPVFRFSPLVLLSSPARYIIVEDRGALHSTRNDWPGIILDFLPRLLGYPTAGVFNCTLLLSIYLVGSLS
jgi:hypothetical protein